MCVVRGTFFSFVIYGGWEGLLVSCGSFFDLYVYCREFIFYWVSLIFSGCLLFILCVSTSTLDLGWFPLYFERVANCY